MSELTVLISISLTVGTNEIILIIKVIIISTCIMIECAKKITN